MISRLAKYSIVLIFLMIAPVVAYSTEADGQAPHEQCGFCHEYDGNSRMALFPRLAGQKSAYIVKQLRDFRSGKRIGQMQATAELLNDNDIFSVADYFSQQPIRYTSRQTQSENELAMAEKIFFKGDPVRGLPSCASCHGRTGQGVGSVPRLAGQHEKYLFEQIELFKSGQRANDELGQMQRISRLLSRREVQSISAFLAEFSSPRIIKKIN